MAICTSVNVERGATKQEQVTKTPSWMSVPPISTTKLYCTSRAVQHNFIWRTFLFPFQYPLEFLCRNEASTIFAYEMRTQAQVHIESCFILNDSNLSLFMMSKWSLLHRVANKRTSSDSKSWIDPFLMNSFWQPTLSRTSNAHPFTSKYAAHPLPSQAEIYVKITHLESLCVTFLHLASGRRNSILGKRARFLRPPSAY